MSGLWRARLLYGVLLLIIVSLIWIYGGRPLYVTLYTMILLPVFSYALTFIALRGLQVSQSAEKSVVIKEEYSHYRITIRNRTPLMYNHIECLFMDDGFAIEAEQTMKYIYARPFMRESHEVPFKVKYRGVYPLGLRALRVNDLTGLFTLQRRLSQTLTLVVWPRVVELSYFPLASNLLSQTQSRFDIREEDYTTVSDVRLYEPTDSIKRVHWKLTAKRNEWMVKNFQANALTRITVILDNTRLPLPYETALPLEDSMVEAVLAVIRYCLGHALPVAFAVGDGVCKEGRTLGDFEALYRMAADLAFEDVPHENRALALLNKHLNESADYLNIVILTARLDAALYERVAIANRIGHYIALLYFATETPDAASDEIFHRLAESGVFCRRLTEKTNLNEVA